MNPKTESASPEFRPKPRLALLVATGLGLGHLPLAPGTWGSLLGLALAWTLRRHDLMNLFLHRPSVPIGGLETDPWLLLSVLLIVGVAVVGVWTSGLAARYFGQSDPQKVVIDEVSGQMIALLGTGWVFISSSGGLTSGPRLLALTAPGWKYLLLGLILFRVFDIWKPFPARQAESLPGGWGIMADDWIAGVYAALGLWLARTLGL